MPTPLENAIAYYQTEVDSYGQGTKAQPADKSYEWFILRAMILGLAYLKRIQVLGVQDDPAACDRVYLKGNLHFKAADVPPAPVIVKEVLPTNQDTTG